MLSLLHTDGRIMDAASVISTIYSTISTLHDTAEQVQGNTHSCSRLSQRCDGLLGPLHALEQDARKLVSAKDSLNRLQLLLEDACEFVRKFKDRPYLLKAWKHNADREAFADFNRRISQAIQELQLGVIVDAGAQRREDVDDARDDIKEIMDIVSRAMDEQGRMCEQIMNELRSAQETQLRHVEAIVNRVGDVLQKVIGVESGQHEIIQRLEHIKQANWVSPGKGSFQHGNLNYQRSTAYRLGFGTSGTVYSGEYHGQQVAVKVILTTGFDLKQRKALQREMEIHQALDSPRIIRLYGIHFEEEMCEMVMEKSCQFA
jgi:ElaB/YqjD/DUF883 family membrane-anchored ribosome-binding protein